MTTGTFDRWTLFTYNELAELAAAMHLLRKNSNLERQIRERMRELDTEPSK